MRSKRAAEKTISHFKVFQLKIETYSITKTLKFITLIQNTTSAPLKKAATTKTSSSR